MPVLVLVLVSVSCATDYHWHVMVLLMACMAKQVMLHLISIILTYGMPAMPMMTPSAIFDATASANGITWLKDHVAPHFDCLD